MERKPTKIQVEDRNCDMDNILMYSLCTRCLVLKKNQKIYNIRSKGNGRYFRLWRRKLFWSDRIINTLFCYLLKIFKDIRNWTFDYPSIYVYIYISIYSLQFHQDPCIYVSNYQLLRLQKVRALGVWNGWMRTKWMNAWGVFYEQKRKEQEANHRATFFLAPSSTHQKKGCWGCRHTQDYTLYLTY